MDIFLQVFRLILPIALVLGCLVLGFLFERKGLKRLKDLVSETHWEGYQIIIDSLRYVSIFWFFLAGLFLSLYILPHNIVGELPITLPIQPKLIFTIIRKTIIVIFGFSATTVAYRLSLGFIDIYSRDANPTIKSLLENITKGIIIALGIWFVLYALGIPSTTILLYVYPVSLILASLLIGLFIQRDGFNKLNELALRTHWEGDELIINSLRKFIILWCLIGGISAALYALPLEFSVFTLIQKILLGLFLGTLTLVVSELSIEFIRLYSGNDGSPTLTSLFEKITKLVVFSLGVLIILQSVGVAITPLITALGVGGVSVGLALKGPLENLMSGVTIITSKKVRPGDYIKLKSGEEGYVTDVELKYTVIKEITGNISVIPNAHLIASSFTNYGLPEKELIIIIEVGVSYDSDLEKVEAVTLDVAKQTLTEVAGGVPEYEPFMRYNQFDYFSINFSVFLQVQEYYEQLIVRHEFIKRLHKRYRDEGIAIPFPLKSGYIPQNNAVNQIIPPVNDPSKHRKI